MSYYLAEKTLAKIESVMQADQGASYRGFLRQAMSEVSDAYDPTTSYFRSHLGASLIGRKCSRELWYSFRWAKKVIHSARMIRLFNRGHLEEARFVAILKCIGCTVWQFDENGNQFRINGVNGHFGGSLDSALKGVPDLDPEEPALGEFKTHSEKSFLKLKDEGVKRAKPEHYTQMQVYMKKYKLKYGLYLAVNKNNDELHAEIILLEPEICDQSERKAELVIHSITPMKKISNNSGWHECKYCDYIDVCHHGEAPDKNCRTCSNSVPMTDGSKMWYCNVKVKALNSDDQKTLAESCDSYSLNMMFYK